MSVFKRACILTILVSTYAVANDERWFQIEVMIFKNPTIEADNPESWPSYGLIEHPEQFIRLEGVSEILTSNSDIDNQSGAVAPERATQLDAPVSKEGLEAFKALSEFERQLVNEKEQISNDRRYELLFHEAWNQPVPGRDTVIPIRVDGGERFGRQSELQGYLNLYVERYLHLSTDLHLIKYQKSSNPFTLVEDRNTNALTSINMNNFGGLSLLDNDLGTNSQISRNSDDFFVSVQHTHLAENRRMRSRELHYFDNPEFGMLVYITPIEIQQ